MESFHSGVPKGIGKIYHSCCSHIKKFSLRGEHHDPQLQKHWALGPSSFKRWWEAAEQPSRHFAMIVKPKFCLIQNSAFRLKVSESFLSDTRITACKQGGEAPRQHLPWTGWWGRSTTVYFDHCNGKGGQRVWRTQKSLKWRKLRYFMISDISHPGSSKSRFSWISHFFWLLWAP